MKDLNQPVIMLSDNKTPPIHIFCFLSLDKQAQTYLHMKNQTEQNL